MPQARGTHHATTRTIMWCHPEDVKFWRLLLWVFSATLFIICALILLSGWCMQHNVHGQRLQLQFSQLEFISTQMGACLENDALVTHGFVVAMAIQMLLLFDSLMRCMQSAACPNADMRICSKFVVSRQGLAIWCGLLIINFVTNMAGVAEFRSLRSGPREQLFHYFSAVCSICLFWAVHFLICVYLRLFTYAVDYKYIYIRNVYLALTLLFFGLWILQIFFVTFFELAKIVEWLILLIGLLLQLYAEFSLYVHTPKLVNSALLRNNTRISACVVCSYVFSTFLFAFVILYFTAPPWFVRTHRIEKNLYTGAEFWSLVIATNVLVVVMLLSASFRGIICDEQQFSVCFLDGSCGEHDGKHGFQVTVIDFHSIQKTAG
jgi:hypothetical protein